MATQATIKTPVGLLTVRSASGKLTGLDISPPGSKHIGRVAGTPLAKQVREQLKQYFSKADYKFNLPLDIQGTEFQKKVWKVMTGIPCGEVMTYGEVAKILGSSPRAVGNACRANPLPIIIPCHRIVSQSGIGGYGGYTHGKVLAIKDWLLHHEGVKLNQAS